MHVGIVTCLNLFATRFDQVLEIVEARALENKYILFDTPGQIEVFTWSASGAIITESISATLPTVVVYVIGEINLVTKTFVNQLKNITYNAINCNT
jgi:hypothetical protein